MARLSRTQAQKQWGDALGVRFVGWEAYKAAVRRRALLTSRYYRAIDDNGACDHLWSMLWLIIFLTLLLVFVDA